MALFHFISFWSESVLVLAECQVEHQKLNQVVARWVFRVQLDYPWRTKLKAWSAPCRSLSYVYNSMKVTASQFSYGLFILDKVEISPTIFKNNTGGSTFLVLIINCTILEVLLKLDFGFMPLWSISRNNPTLNTRFIIHHYSHKINWIGCAAFVAMALSRYLQLSEKVGLKKTTFRISVH